MILGTRDRGVIKTKSLAAWNWMETDNDQTSTKINSIKLGQVQK